jgi:hypothetical protein
MQMLTVGPRSVAVRVDSQPLRTKRPRRPPGPSGNHDRGAWRGAHRRKWLHGAAQVPARDSAVRAVLEEVKGVRMGKRESAIDDLLAYLADESWHEQKKYRRRSR